MNMNKVLIKIQLPYKMQSVIPRQKLWHHVIMLHYHLTLMTVITLQANNNQPIPFFSVLYKFSSYALNLLITSVKLIKTIIFSIRNHWVSLIFNFIILENRLLNTLSTHLSIVHIIIIIVLPNCCCYLYSLISCSTFYWQ